MNDLAAHETKHEKTCAWCATVFVDFVDLLAHVESCHLEDVTPHLDAAA